MRSLVLTERVALASLLLGCIPLAFEVAVLLVPKPSMLAVNICQTAVTVLDFWLWIWAPFYLVLKFAFCWRMYRKEKEAAKRLAKWIIATDIAIIATIGCSFVLKA